jgi:uncharacterized protein (DUF885 family)
VQAAAAKTSGCAGIGRVGARFDRRPPRLDERHDVNLPPAAARPMPVAYRIGEFRHVTTARLLLAASLAALTACTTAETATQAPAAPPPAADAPKRDHAAELKALFAESDEANLKRDPLSALFRGDLRYAAEFGDYISNDYFAAEVAAAEDELRRLNAIPREALSPQDQIAYDVFKWQTELGLRGLRPELLSLTVVRPIDHFNGFHTFFPDISSGEGAAPFKTLADYENNLKRIDGYVTLLDRAIGRFREGMASGVVQPRLVVDNMIGQFDTQIGMGVDDSVFMGPVKKFPAEIPAADQARLRAAYAAAVRDKILPAYKRMRDFLKTEYRPAAREGVGLVHMKGGPQLYTYLIESNTTLPLTADEVHATGLREVARIRAEMEKVKAQVGFKGTLQQFFDHIRTDPKFKPKSKQALTDGYYAIGKRVDVNIGKLFATLPKSPLEIRPVPAYREKNDAAGSYQQGTPDGSRPGIFYFNTYDLPSRTTPGMETLYLHEGAPGHHFQISLAQENTSLPNFMRFGGNTAFVEGWALYAETLGPELGMFTDPYQYFGHLDDQMLRAMRLVVDTGIHAKGWTRDRSINYMLENSSQGKTDTISEVERYIAIPGQALAYMTGRLKIQALRERAERELGPRFDIREFHEQVLMTGALPLAVLESKIDRWIATKKG